jgi:hypothetical protein
MESYFSAPTWDNSDDCPNTTDKAVPCELEKINDKRVIHVVEAFYRGSYFSGHFVIDDEVVMPLPRSGKHFVDVYCRWFGHRLKNRGLRFKVDMESTTFNEHFTGNVFSNFTKKS